MLELKEIKKDYISSNLKVEALKGVNLSFRQKEFVSIIGPSGCGKTTLLNIIGGLDKYTDGDLLINNMSTKTYTDKDFDIYRNHKIGFVFQNYNLIPHQTILENVELSLLISGESKHQRKKKAKEVLDLVGLKGLYNKKPNQLSGGQCQRVAIARAIVNNPQILLCDEPTGALDSETSIQVMDLLKEISLNCLVIMVTHNNELALKYSSRIITLKDGLVTNDTNPYKIDTNIRTKDDNVKLTARMNFFSALKLSLKNLLSKRKRTILTVIDASIGIIGVSSVLSISNGVTEFISNLENDMLSGNPIKISQSGYDYESLLGLLTTSEKSQIIKKDGYISIDNMLEYYSKKYNNVSNFKLNNEITNDYLDYINNMPTSYYNDIVYNYDIDVTNNIYTEYKDLLNSESNYYSLSHINNLYNEVLDNYDFKDISLISTTLSSKIFQLPNNYDYVLSQYDIITGHMPTKCNEMILVVSSNNTISDIMMSLLGYYSEEELINILNKCKDSSLENTNKDNFSYDEILNKNFIYYKNDDIYNYQEYSNCYYNYEYNANNLDKSKGYELKISGILRLKEDISYGTLSNGLYYTNDFVAKFRDDNKQSHITNYAKDKNINTVIMNGMPLKGIYYKYDYTIDNINIISTYGCLGTGTSIVSNLSNFIDSSSTYDDELKLEYYSLSLHNLGGGELPKKVYIYPLDFESKNLITNYLDVWNEEIDIIINNKLLTYTQRNTITYTDNLELIVNIVDELIDTITLMLIGFTSLSLIVSCVMIAIVIYVSVIERIKEIGVIRSLGGRKIDITNLFNAETFILGSFSGIIGIVFTFIIQIFVNIFINKYYGLNNMMKLSVNISITMILLSIILTMLSGLIPACFASRKNPSDALRCE